MSKSWLSGAATGLTRGPVKAVLMLGLCGCQAQSGSAAPPPAWPEQEPPEYPGVSPQPSNDPAAAVPGTSRSPWAATHGGRAAVDRFGGDATYYADSLAGNHTANGEIYRPEAFTAAHRSLPFGTIVRVTRTDAPSSERRVTYVKVNDRGPFGNSRRVIDLSRAAATELEMLRAGVVPVQVEILELPPK